MTPKQRGLRFWESLPILPFPVVVLYCWVYLFIHPSPAISLTQLPRCQRWCWNYLFNECSGLKHNCLCQVVHFQVTTHSVSALAWWQEKEQAWLLTNEICQPECTMSVHGPGHFIALTGSVLVISVHPYKLMCFRYYKTLKLLFLINLTIKINRKLNELC